MQDLQTRVCPVCLVWKVVPIICISLHRRKTLNEGLDRAVRGVFESSIQDARLIIIDTLQKVREVGGDRFSYASDYEIVTKVEGFQR